MAQIKKFYAWIGPINGYAALNWHASQPAKYDWVGLYANEQKQESDYLGYQRVSNGCPYVTSTIITDRLNARYFTWVGDSSHSSPQVSLDEVNDQGQLVVTPASLIASVSGKINERRYEAMSCQTGFKIQSFLNTSCTNVSARRLHEGIKIRAYTSWYSDVSCL